MSTNTHSHAAIKIAVEDYRSTTGTLEWSVEIDGRLWAAGDCEDVADGQAKARRALESKGLKVRS